MLPENQNREHLVPLLPFGETLRPLILASSLKGEDLRFVLQKRGIFVRSARKDNTIPILTSIILSPREFDILKNRQQLKESTPKTSDAKTTWGSNKTVVQAMPDECERFIQGLVGENLPYRLANCSVQTVTSDQVVVDCSIERQDWTKDAFSSTTYHDCSFSITKDPESNIVTYHTETTAPETKDLMSKVQKAFHSHFRQQGAISKDTPVQKILAHHFFTNEARFEFLHTFVEQGYEFLSFEKITDIGAGIDHGFPNFPKNFSWLRNNIDSIDVRGEGVHLTEIVKLGRMGILILGEIEAEFQFQYSDAKGTCSIRYGFPDYYLKKSSMEFEAKVVNLTFHPDYSDASKKRVGKFLLHHFQNSKHNLFEQFIAGEKANAQKKNMENQYQFEGEGWE